MTGDDSLCGNSEGRNEVIQVEEQIGRAAGPIRLKGSMECYVVTQGRLLGLRRGFCEDVSRATVVIERVDTEIVAGDSVGTYGHRGSRMPRHIQPDLPRLIPPALAKPTARSPPQQKAVLGVSVECDVSAP